MGYHGTIRWVCEHWANQERLTAKSRHEQVYFRDRSLFSWGEHYELARLVEYQGRTLALINESDADLRNALLSLDRGHSDA